ncbi:hypothetical protein KHC33_07110 [Methanospirillum sp. J.3.6.1-F.2.7.3]|uniref:Uncharacterized protein n=1 Tax=Methanospirillum purgamenti TaxID=2834276 RepID=A0A8E7B4C6_9EURY|nr:MULTISPECIES: hypothetical protein [Methanospirillum]MDX8550686.1 hypothetical protein [Methanospirillum hungatei]QVV90242.1 hypothetical protein KHC33_07110 [Methanospirillum sp. J.3.6.1-F.2.7.3]
MTRYQYLSLTILLSLLLLTGISSAAESYDYLAYLQGGESIIVNDTDDMMIITVHNPDPYLNITNNMSTIQSPVDSLMNASLPMNAALIFSAPDTEITSIIRIENLSLSDDKESLTLQVRALDFYDGAVLAPYEQDSVNLHQLDNMTFNETRLYLEMMMIVPENSFPPKSACDKCQNKCYVNYQYNMDQCLAECDVFC